MFKKTKAPEFEFVTEKYRSLLKGIDKTSKNDVFAQKEGPQYTTSIRLGNKLTIIVTKNEKKKSIFNNKNNEEEIRIIGEWGSDGDELFSHISAKSAALTAYDKKIEHEIDIKSYENHKNQTRDDRHRIQLEERDLLNTPEKRIKRLKVLIDSVAPKPKDMHAIADCIVDAIKWIWTEVNKQPEMYINNIALLSRVVRMSGKEYKQHDEIQEARKIKEQRELVKTSENDYLENHLKVLYTPLGLSKSKEFTDYLCTELLKLKLIHLYQQQANLPLDHHHHHLDHHRPSFAFSRGLALRCSAHKANLPLDHHHLDHHHLNHLSHHHLSHHHLNRHHLDHHHLLDQQRVPLGSMVLFSHKP